MIDFAPGMRTIIRDEEWMVKKIETNSLGNKTLYCVGVSPLVKDREAIFLTDLEKIQIVDPAEVKLVADVSPFYKRALLYLESQWRQQIPTDANLHIGHKAAMDLMPYQLDPAKLALQRPRQRILIADTVGLGKTLEAGILMSELIARGKGKRILVVTVKSMMTQFQKEMWNRFTIPLVRLDSNRIQKINVRGRSSILKINYRTTEEIRKHAFALLNGISFDDLDEDLDLGDKCQSLTHGEKPIVENFENANDEFDFLLREVKKLKENGVSLTDICVVARTKKLVDDYIALFTRAGIRSYAIKRNKVDDRSFDGLRVATMHRVKGLEFKYVFIAAVNNRIIPMPSAINKTDVVSEAESITSEKCLLYVAMTRAQKGVYITSYGRPSEFLG